MNTLNISLGSGMGVTVLSNVFIDEYMCDANDAQLKVYLYLVRQVMSGGTTDISEMADIFNYTEKDIVRALNYWEKRKVLTLVKNNEGDIESVAFLDINTLIDSAKVTDEHVTETHKESTLPRRGSIAMISMDYESEKNNYSLDDIKALSVKKEVKMLINVASQYFGRPLNSEEIRTLLFIYDRLAFSFDMTDYLLEYCAKHNKCSMRVAEQVAINWYEQGISSVDAAKASAKGPDKDAYAVMKALGKTSEPAPPELEYIGKWFGTYGFSLDIINEACKRTVMSTDKNRFQYADTILKSWYNAGVKGLKDIEDLDTKFAESKSRKVAINAPKPSEKKSAFCNIMQHDYDYAADEAALARLMQGQLRDMALSNSQYDIIQKKYDEKRRLHRQEADKRKEEIFLKVPDFKKLEMDMIDMSMDYARKNITGHGSKEEKEKSMEEYHAKMLDVRLMKNRLLVEHGYPKDYLDVHYDCLECKDTGYVDGEKCTCFKCMEVEFLYDKSQIKELLAVNNFQNLSYDYCRNEEDLAYFKNAVTTCRNFVNNFNSDYHNLFFYGTVGTGKSFLSGCVAKELMDRGCAVVYFSAVNLFQSISNLFYDKDRTPLNSLLDTLYTSDLLIIDDLGAEMTNEFIKSQLFSIINERVLRRKSIVISTNYTLEEFGKTYSERLYSRLYESFEIIKLTGCDIRREKKLGNIY